MAACLNLQVRKLFVIVIYILGFNVSMSAKWRTMESYTRT